MDHRIRQLQRRIAAGDESAQQELEELLPHLGVYRFLYQDPQPKYKQEKEEPPILYLRNTLTYDWKRSWRFIHYSRRARRYLKKKTTRRIRRAVTAYLRTGCNPRKNRPGTGWDVC